MLYTYRDIVRENGYKDFVNYFNELDNFLFCENTDFCFDKKYLEFTAEEIYFKLLENQKNVKSESMECDFNGTEVEISETTDNKGHKSVTVKNKKSGDDTGNENSNDNSNGNKQMQDKINKQRMLDGISKELNKIKERGLNSVNTNIILKKLNHVKVDWERILRDSLLTELEKGDDYSWQSLRPSMF